MVYFRSKNLTSVFCRVFFQKSKYSHGRTTGRLLPRFTRQDRFDQAVFGAGCPAVRAVRPAGNCSKLVPRLSASPLSTWPFYCRAILNLLPKARSVGVAARGCFWLFEGIIRELQGETSRFLSRFCSLEGTFWYPLHAWSSSNWFLFVLAISNQTDLLLHIYLIQSFSNNVIRICNKISVFLLNLFI